VDEGGGEKGTPGTRGTPWSYPLTTTFHLSPHKTSTKKTSLIKKFKVTEVHRRRLADHVGRRATEPCQCKPEALWKLERKNIGREEKWRMQGRMQGREKDEDEVCPHLPAPGPANP